jgi:Zn-dependent protease with chaperone function
MSLTQKRRFVLVLLAIAFLVPHRGNADEPKKAAAIPSKEEVAALLQKEPITLASWKTWRGRLLTWIDDRSTATDAAYVAAWSFVKGQVNPQGELSPELAKDAVAWYLLGSAYLDDAGASPDNRPLVEKAEPALRRSLQLDPNLALAHFSLALVLFHLENLDNPPNAPPRRAPAKNRWAEIDQELQAARRLDPSLPISAFQAAAAVRLEHFADAERLFHQALAENPDMAAFAQGEARAILLNRAGPKPVAPRIQKLLDKFPDDGELICFHAAALYNDGEPRAAARELDRARQLGTDPTRVLLPEEVRKIEEEGAPSKVELFAWIMAGFAGFYALVMLLMAGAGVLLAGRTRGNRALDLLGAQQGEMVRGGQVARTRDESVLAKLYAFALFAGLVLFYLSIPFVIAGLLAVTGLLLYFIFFLPRIPVKLIVIVVVIGLGGVWAVLRSLFARPASGSFGLPKTAADCPRIYQVLAEVAGRVDTGPVDEVYVAPGSAIGVHQEGRGPFGIFGVKRRVLTLGLSTMHFLTVEELKAILAHEYAHFSHSDTFYSRFIYQVTLSIEQALNGMGSSGGAFNYVNPFYWFLLLYYKSYRLLASGYSRSREFLADRMASTLYGSDIFANALTKVGTDGTLFEMTIYGNISRLLEEDRAFINMYEAFRSFRNEQLSQTEREELYQKLLSEEGSLFASHPTFKERMEAVAELPRATQPDTSPALGLFENAEEMEKELTDFLTGYVHHVRMLQAQAAAAAE